LNERPDTVAKENLLSDVFLSPGLRTPFVKAGGGYTQRSAIDLSVPVAKAMSDLARPDFLV